MITRTNANLTQQQYDALYLLAYNRPALFKPGGIIENLILSNANREEWEEAILAEYKLLKGWNVNKNGWTNRINAALELYFYGDYIRNY